MKEGNRVELAGAALVLVGVVVYALLYFAADVGLWAWLLLGVAAVGAAIFVVGRYQRSHLHPSAAAAPRPAAAASAAGGKRRVLVVADVGSPAEDLRRAVPADTAGIEVLVVAPALGSRLDRWTGDQTSYDDAQSRVDEWVGALAALGIDVHGHVGSHDPLQAADDGLREFPADELIFVTGSSEDENWLEAGVVADARGRYGIPVGHITPSGAGPA